MPALPGTWSLVAQLLLVMMLLLRKLSLNQTLLHDASESQALITTMGGLDDAY